jgi:glycosyltransferase involved in cell wall biosynthesis
MNILLYCNSFLPSIGGREMVIHYLAKNLGSIGHNVRVAGVSGWWRYRKLSFEYPVHRWPTLRGLIDKTIKIIQLRLECSIWKTDIIHAHNTYPSGYIAAKVCKKNHIPLVITPHGMDIHVIPELGFGHRLDSDKREMSDYALKAAVLTTAISANIKHSLNKAGVPDGKIRFIPNGIDLERFQGSSTVDIRQHYKLPQDAHIILAVGNYHKRKGLELLIEAMPNILVHRKNVFLLIVGRSDDILKERVESLKLYRNVILTGPIQFPASVLLSVNRSSQQRTDQIDLLAAIYSQSDVYVSASMNEGAEGLSLALLDAAAAGLPIVATNISGNRDLVENGTNGYLVPPGDHASLAQAIIKILSHEKVSDNFGKRNKIASKTYSWRKIASEYLGVYKEAIGKISG